MPRPRTLLDFRMEAVSYELLTLERGEAVSRSARVAGYFYHVLEGGIVARAGESEPIEVGRADTLVVSGLLDHTITNHGRAPARLLVGAEPFEHLTWMKGTPSLQYIAADDPSPLVRRLHLAMALVIEEISDRQTPIDQLTLERTAELILIYFIRLGAPEPGPLEPYPWSDARLMAVITALSAQPEKSWTVAAMARLASMSRSAFASRFRRQLGETPMQMLSRIRLRAAAERILQGVPIAEAALQVGYGSNEAFCRAFKRLFGVTPGRWKRQRAG